MVEVCPVALPERKRRKNDTVRDPGPIGAVSLVVRYFEAREGIRARWIENWGRMVEVGEARR
jgi:hypothetical protein